eukprot:TRINITY_DN2928_c0_g2_i1.p1 TRINITY_DN2928_c0_g2~~TRINITY_DN2928_c0_g2_i1.p1  ORF type:complete len:279 (+),score=43.25 TRINITY_DN2928_c0_g2_i1:137-973(+)
MEQAKQIYHLFSQGCHVTYIPAMILGLVIARRMIIPIIDSVYPKTKGVSNETRKNNIDSIFYVLTIAFSMGIGIYTTWGAPWWRDYSQALIGYPFTPFVDPSLRWYYTWGLSFYLFWGFCVTFLDEKKKDYAAMVIHHVVTFVTIAYACINGMHPIGTVVMLTFDPCDIFLECAKICNRAKFEPGAIGFFVVFVITWFKYRVIEYPQLVWTFWNSDKYTNEPVPLHSQCMILISIILVLQWYWTIFIVKKLQSVVREGISGSSGDPRDATMKEFQKQK